MTNLQKAQALDQSDRLAEFYQLFYHPENEIYLDGNSLGKQPLKTKERLVSVLDWQWGSAVNRQLEQTLARATQTHCRQGRATSERRLR